MPMRTGLFCKDGQAEEIMVNIDSEGFGTSDRDVDDIAFIEIYGYTCNFYGNPEYEFTNCVTIDVKEFVDWSGIKYKYA